MEVGHNLGYPACCCKDFTVHVLSIARDFTEHQLLACEIRRRRRSIPFHPVSSLRSEDYSRRYIQCGNISRSSENHNQIIQFGKTNEIPGETRRIYSGFSRYLDRLFYEDSVLPGASMQLPQGAVDKDESRWSLGPGRMRRPPMPERKAEEL